MIVEDIRRDMCLPPAGVANKFMPLKQPYALQNMHCPFNDNTAKDKCITEKI
jgi:hypothetical protein